MKIGSLFAGIGGFDLAAREMGWETRWYSEIEPYAAAVMKKNFPEAVNHGDVTKIDGRTVEPVDILCGGFPCQDISLAGKGAGIEGERSGLWKHYARLIEEIRPRYVVAENVAALRTRGLDVVLQDLAAIGYDAEWHCIPASYVGAPHRRDRIWIVAYPAGSHDGSVVAYAYQQYIEQLLARRRAERGEEATPAGAVDSDVAGSGAGSSRRQDVADPDGDAGDEGRSRDGAQGEGGRDADRGGVGAHELDDTERARLEGHAGDVDGAEGRPVEDRSAAEAGLPRGANTFGWWDVEPDVGRVANGVPSRVDRLRCLGNAIVPQVALFLFQAIEEAERAGSALRAGVQ